MKRNGENLDTRMNKHGHTCSHQPSPTYQKNGIKWKKPEVKHSYGMNSEKISLKISTLSHKMKSWSKQQNRLKNLYNRQTRNCKNIQTGTIPQSTRLQLENENIEEKTLHGNQTMLK